MVGSKWRALYWLLQGHHQFIVLSGGYIGLDWRESIADVAVRVDSPVTFTKRIESRAAVEISTISISALQTPRFLDRLDIVRIGLGTEGVPQKRLGIEDVHCRPEWVLLVGGALVRCI